MHIKYKHYYLATLASYLHNSIELEKRETNANTKTVASHFPILFPAPSGN